MVAEMEFSRVLTMAAATDCPLAGQSGYDVVAVLVARLGCVKVVYSVVSMGDEMAAALAAWLVEHWVCCSAVAMVDRTASQ